VNYLDRLFRRRGDGRKSNSKYEPPNKERAMKREMTGLSTAGITLSLYRSFRRIVIIWRGGKHSGLSFGKIVAAIWRKALSSPPSPFKKERGETETGRKGKSRSSFQL